MYELNDPECNLICELRARDNETLEIITPEYSGPMLMAAPYFPPFYRGVRKVRLQKTRTTLQMLIQRRLRANGERPLDGRGGGSHLTLLGGSVPQRDDADTHPFFDRSSK